MNPLTLNDLNALHQLITFIAIFSCGLGLFFSSILYRLYKKIIRQINFPTRVKTEEGYLYRSIKGTYVSKERLEEILFENKLKRRKFYIAFHRSMLKRLEIERVSTSESGNQNSETSSL